MAGEAEEVAADAEQSRAFGVLVTVGLFGYGLIHLTVAWIALQLAWAGNSGAQANQRGAFQQLASAPLGPLWLWIAAVGLFALVLWRLCLAVWGFRWKRGWRRTSKRWGSIGQAVVYAALGASAVSVVLGSGSSGGGQRSASAQLMRHPSGRWVLGAIAVIIIGIGVFLAVKGITRRFADELQDGGTPMIIIAGQFGYVAKGCAYVVVGMIIGSAALRHNANQAAGLDGTLRMIKQQPYGPYLLTALAVGFACFGLYCFGWARRARR